LAKLILILRRCHVQQIRNSLELILPAIGDNRPGNVRRYPTDSR
jgi:hypothetical protein